MNTAMSRAQVWNETFLYRNLFLLFAGIGVAVVSLGQLPALLSALVMPNDMQPITAIVASPLPDIG